MYSKLIVFKVFLCLALTVLSVSGKSTDSQATKIERATRAVSKSSQEDTEYMEERVGAVVILRNAAGLSILDADGPVTAENEAKYQVEREIVEKTSMELEKLGITVTQVGPHSLSIMAEKDVFDAVFETNLESRSAETMGTKMPGVEASYYIATTPIKVPESLSSMIADVDLETPVEYFP